MVGALSMIRDRHSRHGTSRWRVVVLPVGVVLCLLAMLVSAPVAGADPPK
jgi:hypothetical protein